MVLTVLMLTTDAFAFLTKLEKDPGAPGKSPVDWALDNDSGRIRTATISPAAIHSPGHGRCAFYEFRFLVCRLFGFAARKGKSGRLEFSTCKIIRQNFPEAISAVDRSLEGGPVLSNVEGFDLRPLEGPAIPVYQEMFMRIATLEPGTGFLRYPVNQAIRKAIERFYWKKAKPHRKSA